MRTTVLKYADDMILFLSHTDGLEVRLCRWLSIFYMFFGLCINHHKSYLYRVNLDLGMFSTSPPNWGAKCLALQLGVDFRIFRVGIVL